jgi:hypothetical protein
MVRGRCRDRVCGCGWRSRCLWAGCSSFSGLVFCHTAGGVSRLVGCCRVWWRVGLGTRLLFVNCIVDASIFVAKFFRAHGGCLGIRSR